MKEQKEMKRNNLIMITSKRKPPIGGMGGSIHDWERGESPWNHKSFPSELKDQAPEQGDSKEGWLSLDWCGNIIGFIADGTYYDKK